MACGLLVFLGPTLPVLEARALAPDAIYLPPVRCGDVLRALRLGPSALLIIDGSFERTPAVWHKEIAVALERGVAVHGASSMGALRAAEMCDLGMRGIGGIFEDYRDGRLVDDDEVTVIHSATHEPLSTALVDIRATLERAVDHGVLEPERAASLVALAKRTFYPERSLPALLSRLPSDSALEHFAAWLSREGLVERKRADAREALSLLAGGGPPEAPRVGPRVPRTVALRVLFRHAAGSVVRGDDPRLPKTERVLQAARFLGDSFRDARRLAELSGTLSQFAPSTTEAGAEPWWLEEMGSARWAELNDCDESAQLALHARGAALAALERRKLGAPSDPTALLAFRAATSESRYLRWLDALDGTGATRERSELASVPRVRRLLARAWRLLDSMGREAGLLAAAAPLQTVFQSVRGELALHEPADVSRWMEVHRLDRQELGALLLARFRWHAIATGAQAAALGASGSEEGLDCLLDALRLSGLYSEARALLEMDATSRLRAAIFPSTLAEALVRDFDTDEPNELRRALLGLSA